MPFKFCLRALFAGEVQCELEESWPSAVFDKTFSNEDAMDDDDAVDDATVVPDPFPDC
jgi:hypothetical protein